MNEPLLISGDRIINPVPRIRQHYDTSELTCKNMEIIDFSRYLNFT